MHSDVAISVENLTKTYRIFGHPGDRIKQALMLGQKRFHREFTALQDVSFEIKKGETVGIIGRNGSGKSTLLQLICGILKPTSGAVRVNGRISALLELGAGFNPEFTGRENVYFQGAVMGITKMEMEARFNEIADFADIGEFIDQPVRVYSSGMYLRLAFAVAVNVDSEILVVDEALAVGDAGFRSRCFRRIGELKSAGCTILFVSHETEQIVRLCSHAMLIDAGALLLGGPPDFVVSQFQRLMTAEANAHAALRRQIQESQFSAGPDSILANQGGETAGGSPTWIEAYDPALGPAAPIAYESNGALIKHVQILTTNGQRVNHLFSGRTYRCSYQIHFMRQSANVRCAILIKTSALLDLGGAYSAPTPTDGVSVIPGGANVDATFDFKCMLNPGVYFVSVSVFGSLAGVEYALHGITGAEVFRVVADRKHCGISNVDFDCQASMTIVGSKRQ
jgi:lipopolysaccharide transport system ATP-binding protein